MATVSDIMADARSVLSTLLFCLWWPTSILLHALSTILSPFWAAVHFLFLPVTHLAHAILTLILLPFRLHVLERFETIYIWLGMAGLIGCIAGATLFVVFRILTSALSIDDIQQSKAHANGRTITEFREARRLEQETLTEPSSGPTVLKYHGPTRRGLMTQITMDDEFDF